MPEKVKRETRAERKRKQIGEFCGALLSYPTVEAAAQSVGVSARTATRWLKSPEFRDAYVESRQATIEAAAGLLRASASGCIETLAMIAIDKESPATARVSAAKSVLDTMLKITELSELEARLRTLESNIIAETEE